jgi:hypothetical protein
MKFSTNKGYRIKKALHIYLSPPPPKKKFIYIFERPIPEARTVARCK